MRKKLQVVSLFAAAVRVAPMALTLLALSAAPALAQSPWEESASKLSAAFTGPIAKALSLVAIVVGGLAFAYGEGAGKKTIAGIVFGCGMALGAMQFMSWLF